jgi:hypothetical protein
MHPGRTVKQAITPKTAKRASRTLHPIDNAVYSIQRSEVTAIRSGGKRKAAVSGMEFPGPPSEPRSCYQMQESVVANQSCSFEPRDSNAAHVILSCRAAGVS